VVARAKEKMAKMVEVCILLVGGFQRIRRNIMINIKSEEVSVGCVEDVYADGELMEGISRSLIDFGGWKVGELSRARLKDLWNLKMVITPIDALVHHGGSWIVLIVLSLGVVSGFNTSQVLLGMDFLPQ
jgi:hypothetical protein